jgi:hypothetical protein
MRHVSNGIVAAALALLAGAAGAAGPPSGPLTKCPVDAVVSGAGCMDKYEASVWRVPNPTTANTKLVAKIQSGKVTVADLTAGGATQLGVAGPDYAPCAASGQNCANDIYAVSLPGVTPAAFLTWFQAQAACTNAGKRLPSNAATARPTATPIARCRWSSRDPAAAASRRAAPSTWWATCTSGWPTGCRDRRRAEPGAPASARQATTSVWPEHAPRMNPVRCCAAATSAAGRVPVRSPSLATAGCHARSSASASAAPASPVDLIDAVDVADARS